MRSEFSPDDNCTVDGVGGFILLGKLLSWIVMMNIKEIMMVTITVMTSGSGQVLVVFIFL